VSRALSGRPVVFGEALFDEFDDGTEVLGGAPLNVAWHLAAFGLDPLFVSAVGDDARGRAIRERMTAWGMDTAGVQIDSAHPTGEVRVRFEHGEPRYEILADRAYDFVDAGDARDAVHGADIALIVHGSLAARNEESARALDALLAAFGAPALMDVNLRPPWFARDRVRAAVANARWAKLNAEELRTLTDDGDDDARVRSLFAGGMLEEVVLTRGARGAVLHRPDEAPIRIDARSPVDFSDAVGAGDAFCAVVAAGLIRGWNAETRLTRAAVFASAVCGVRGAVPGSRTFYEHFLREWETDDRTESIHP
jgi:fructokinase